MEDLRKYLSTPEQQRMYSEGIALLRQYGGEMYARQWQELRIGPMGNNRRRLFDVLQQVTASVGPENRVEISVNTVGRSAPGITPNSRLELDLILELRKNKQLRARCSQQFHDCHTDAERAEVCRLIDDATAKIRETERKITHVQRFGRLPEKEELEEEPLPDDLDELKKEAYSLSSNILKVEKRIAHLLTLPVNNRKRKKLPEKEDYLRQLTARRAAARIKLKRLRNARKENAARGGESA